MTSVSIQQARQRFASLPPTLQDTVFSYQVAEIIKKIGEANHLPQDKTSAVADAAGIAMLGFIHVEELAREIQDRAQVPLELAKNISASIENRILNSIRGDLERVYAPVPPEPAKMEDVTKPPAPAPIPVAPKPPAGAPAPKPFVDLATLKTTPAAGAPPRPAPPVGLPTPPAPSKPATAALASAVPVPPAPPPSTPAAPAPVFLKRALETEPVKPPASIRLQPNGGPAKPTAPPARPARLEIGGPPVPPTKPAAARTEVSPPRVVHYTGPQSQVPTKELPKTDTPPPAPAGPSASTGKVSPFAASPLLPSDFQRGIPPPPTPKPSGETQARPAAQKPQALPATPAKPSVPTPPEPTKPTTPTPSAK